MVIEEANDIKISRRIEVVFVQVPEWFYLSLLYAPENARGVLLLSLRQFVLAEERGENDGRLVLNTGPHF